MYRHTRTFLLAAIAPLFLVTPLAFADVLYVHASAAGANDGSSWTDAFIDLQAALAVTVAGDEIWVGEGVYRPHGDSDLTRRFRLVDGVGLYGGFRGDELVRADRNWQSYVTELTGTRTDGIPEDCSGYANIPTVIVDGSGVGPSAILDGFMITRTRCRQFPQSSGMFVAYGSPTVTNMVFSDSDGGTPMLNTYASPTVTNSLFLNNTCRRGGGIYNEYSTTTIMNCEFRGAWSGFGGGGRL